MRKGADIIDDNAWHETKIRVRYKDTDRMGLVYYGNYLTFFEVARNEFMRDLGYSYARIEDDGYGMVVIEASAKYHGNTHYDALLTVKSMICVVKRIRVRFDYHVFDGNGKLIVSGYTEHACINEQKRPVRIPEKLLQILQKNGFV